MIRKPAVADAFYPKDPAVLKEMISRFMKLAEIEDSEASGAVSFVAPHAGYLYSGQVASYTYKALAAAHAKRKFDSIVAIGPNHTGLGKPIAVSLRDWETPLGVVKNDVELSRAIVGSDDYISIDEQAHTEEHSVEVQLPFIQNAIGAVPCVFICMGDQSYEAGVLLGKAIINSSSRLKRRVAVIASSDFDHYEPANVAREKDMHAIDALKRLDTEAFSETLMKDKDTACGHGPICVAALFAKEHGAKKGIILKYANSGDVTRDYNSVVAYLSMAFV